MKLVLTEKGLKEVNNYINELKAKRKEILDAGKDTAENTKLPTIEDIQSDIYSFEEVGNYYYNNWGVTDNYNGDKPIYLVEDIDYMYIREEN